MMLRNSRSINGNIVYDAVSKLQIAKAISYAEVGQYGDFEVNELWDELAPDNRKEYLRQAFHFQAAIIKLTR